ncbi:hypothetical protein [Streptomyces sp. NRRL F-5135]|uniref:hypothetical protein n=1 Tax=Streptomyces sp. NRRL F-5135 TaxID=1463858 RepID=UPI0004CBF70A|nr:hypothetical protein [Streptomyces sp. NRRL F-5135]
MTASTTPVPSLEERVPGVPVGSTARDPRGRGAAPEARVTREIHALDVARGRAHHASSLIAGQ